MLWINLQFFFWSFQKKESNGPLPVLLPGQALLGDQPSAVKLILCFPSWGVNRPCAQPGSWPRDAWAEVSRSSALCAHRATEVGTQVTQCGAHGNGEGLSDLEWGFLCSICLKEKSAAFRGAKGI